MRYLLDTHAFLWWIHDFEKLSTDALKIIQDNKNSIFISSVTSWEIMIKKSLGKILFDIDVHDALARNNFVELPITISHTLGLGELPPHHFDPFDRLLIAQTKIENLKLVTRDENILKYDINILKC